ncbi:HNH endonuclease signature motif containing protein [Flavobacterium sp. Fl-318]|uniref:HNH endonuclease signature motif containing protein n=1 Tax=Flavobacterium cupriresistens TaxID=2893885 RepID=A0ABU4RHC5_9FLAO|nr:MULTISPECIES: HNH endonuclease signature motif containing protein [unclassified Flavobacterium]MDX6191967.1 HNH endonuclease signature motif containing protein [Flavobacterium sp. Fl-318]UFH44606.1 HNH endonuclease [Flavobacterium sp. F-323]
MGFPKKVKNQILVLCARHCCVCHKNVGLNMEIHHIKPEAEGGENTLENAIALCFNCHSFAGHNYNNLHPKGIKYSREELFLHKAKWIKMVEENKISSKDTLVELSITNKGSLKPIFIKEITTYIDRDSWKRVYEILGKNPMELIDEIKSNSTGDFYYRNIVNKIETYDQYIDFMNGDFPEKDFSKMPDIKEVTNCQPLNYLMPSMLGYNYTKEKNLSNCILDLKFTNYGPEVLEDYKLYIIFDEVVEIDSVNKRNSWDDIYKYKYNVRFIESNKAEFVPEQNVLVQNDSVIIDSICFRTDYKTKYVVIKWELFARNFQDEGLLKVPISPTFEKSEQTRFEINAKGMKPKTRILPKIVTT